MEDVPMFGSVKLESALYMVLGTGVESKLVSNTTRPRPDDLGISRELDSRGMWCCCSCQDTFATVHQFDAHLGRHRGLCRRRCHLCGLELWATMAGLRRHLTTHAASPPFGRDRRQNLFKLARHVRRLGISTLVPAHRFRCSACGRHFMFRSVLRAHSATHGEQRRSTCTVCRQAFSHRAVLKIHGRIHARPREHECQRAGCGYRTHEETSLRKHECLVHRKIRKVSCEACSRIFFHLKILRRHVKRAHKEGKGKPHTLRQRRPFDCQTLNAPKTTNTDASKHACSLCQKAFRTRRNLATHLSSDHTERELRYRKCATASKRSPQLAKRPGARDVARPHVCACGRAFKMAVWLRRHGQVCRRALGPTIKQLDQPDQPVRQAVWCLECERELHNDVGLGTHYQAHHADAGPFQCPDCGTTFLRARQFGRHRAQTHVMYVPVGSPPPVEADLTVVQPQLKPETDIESPQMVPKAGSESPQVKPEGGSEPPQGSRRRRWSRVAPVMAETGNEGPSDG